jgi:hypothetical protein
MQPDMAFSSHHGGEFDAAASCGITIVHLAFFADFAASREALAPLCPSAPLPGRRRENEW